MSSIARFLNSTIGKKVLMSATGLAMVLFLVAHLIGNLLIVFRGRDAFNDYSHTLLEMKPWIYVAEIGLLAIFVAHIYAAVALSKISKTARPQGYYGFGLAEHTSRKSPMSSNMLITGALIGVFVVLHVAHFKFGTEYLDEQGRRDLFKLVVEDYKDSIFIVIGYLVAMLLLGLHLVHGIHSAFQTFGIPHRNNLMRATQGLAVAIAAGFGVIPVIVHFMGDSML